MSKRKGDEPTGELPLSGELEIQLVKGKNQIFEALKYARAFERQKMGRRKKQCEESSETQTAERIGKEEELLKNLDLEKVAQDYLYRTLGRVKSLHAWEDFTRALKRFEITIESRDNLYANVTSRLYKSHQVKPIIDPIIDGLKSQLNIAPAAGAAQQKRQKVDAETTNASNPAPAGSSDPAPASTSDPAPADESDEDELDQKRKKASASSTTFLPSLSMGGYISGSESGSDPSDTEIKQRKNRRGQKARQALWEKKYGEGAKHLSKPKGRDRGWDAKKGAVGPKSREVDARSRTADAKTPAERPRGQTGNLQKSFKKPPPSEDKPAHPSWEAARKRKDQTKGLQFQGKKVVFD